MAAPILSGFATVTVAADQPNNAFNAAMATTTQPTLASPSTSALSFAADDGNTSAACDCTQLRYAVIALSTILGTLVLSLVVFSVLKARRWVRRGAVSRDGEVKELRREKEDAERRERDAVRSRRERGN
jgi:hypothetical protein